MCLLGQATERKYAAQTFEDDLDAMGGDMRTLQHARPAFAACASDGLMPCRSGAAPGVVTPLVDGDMRNGGLAVAGNHDQACQHHSECCNAQSAI